MAQPTLFFLCCEMKTDERATWRGERIKNKKNHLRAYICDYCSFAKQFVYLHIFTSIDVGVFWVKMCKLSTFCILQIFAITDVIALIL